MTFREPWLPSREFREYLVRAAGALDCAVQLCGDLVIGRELDSMESRLDELAAFSARKPGRAARNERS